MKIRACRALCLGGLLLAGPVICAGADSNNLLISVLQTDDRELVRELLANAPGAAVNESAYQAAAGVYTTDSVRPSGNFQQVRVMEGTAAHLSTVSYFPEVQFLWAENTGRRLSTNVGLVERESESGFHVRAELQGNEVSLQLDLYNGQPRSEYDDYALPLNIRTAVYGQLGEWLDAGGSLALEDASPVHRSYTLQRKDPAKTRLLIKVEMAP